MKRILSAFLCATILLYVSCSDETVIFETDQDSIEVETNQSVLDNSLSMDNAGVLDIFSEDQTTGKFARFADEQAGDYPLTLVAQISPPSYTNAQNLTASHVHVDGDFAYVSYNTVDAKYAGGIDIVNVADPNSPYVSGRLYYTNADISSVKYEDGYVYAAGGVDSEKSVLATANSFVAKIKVENGRFNLSAGILYGFQEGFVATDVETNGNEVIVTSGKDGFVTRYNKNTMEAIDDASYTDLRSIDVRDNKIGLLDADFGVRILDNNLAELSSIPIDADFRVADKRTLAISPTKVMVSEGDAGAGVYDLNTGSFLERVAIPINPDNVAQSDIVTNAVAVNEDVLLMANGGAGLCLSDGIAAAGSDLVGIIKLNGSINYVESKGDYIFAASGRNGLQIIKMNKPSDSLDGECASTQEYRGSSNLSVNSGQQNAYNSGNRGKRLRSLTVDGELLICGTWTVRNGVNIGDDATLEMNGTLIVARNSRRRNLTVGENGTFRVEGSLTIYGDLVLEDGATLEFIGSDSRVNIFGNVERGDNVTVMGTFDDVQDKF
ncbi:hypothetical protein [Allomuricauda sp. d1]|uniref:hypothetical protein n=1 Tax=Allomuricauda sp. d1 TaxID=3136725 RepID=UPI0031E14C20